MSLRQSGEVIPDMVRFGAFPFEIGEQLNSIMNISGGAGPIIAPAYLPNLGERGPFSGILGPGTFYPISGSLDSFMRMFWGVRSWKFTMSVTVNGTAFPLFPFSLGLTSLCSEAGVGYEIIDSISRTLTTEDLFNAIDLPGDYQVRPDSAFTTIQPCVPLDPIQKWQDLMCRKDYFTWSPKDSIVQSFKNSNSKLALTGDLKSSYVSTNTPTFPVYNDMLGVCTLYPPKTFSYFSLSLMNRDFLSQSGIIPILDNQDIRFNKYTGFVEGQIDLINEDKDSNNNYFGSIWESGTPLIDKWGQVTGYGQAFKTVRYTPNIFYKNYIDPSEVNYLKDGDFYLEELNPPTEFGYFPLINFTYRMRPENSVANPSQWNIYPDVTTTISSRMPYAGARHVGDLTISDSSGILNDGLPFGTNRKIAVIPLFGETIFANCTITASLSPATLWINKENLDTQILN